MSSDFVSHTLTDAFVFWSYVSESYVMIIAHGEHANSSSGCLPVSAVQIARVPAQAVNACRPMRPYQHMIDLNAAATVPSALCLQPSLKSSHNVPSPPQTLISLQHHILHLLTNVTCIQTNSIATYMYMPTKTLRQQCILRQEQRKGCATRSLKQSGAQSNQHT